MLHSNEAIMTFQEPTRGALGDFLANSGAMEPANPSAMPYEQSRRYQLEMFEASMARNIIVVVVPLRSQLILLY